jgi:hypothetical protein
MGVEIVTIKHDKSSNRGINAEVTSNPGMLLSPKRLITYFFITISWWSPLRSPVERTQIAETLKKHPDGSIFRS